MGKATVSEIIDAIWAILHGISEIISSDTVVLTSAKSVQTILFFVNAIPVASFQSSPEHQEILKILIFTICNYSVLILLFVTILYYLQLFLLFLLGQLFIVSQIVKIVRIVRIVKIVEIVGCHRHRRRLIIIAAAPLCSSLCCCCCCRRLPSSGWSWGLSSVSINGDKVVLTFHSHHRCRALLLLPAGRHQHCWDSGRRCRCCGWGWWPSSKKAGARDGHGRARGEGIETY